MSTTREKRKLQDTMTACAGCGRAIPSYRVACDSCSIRAAEIIRVKEQRRA